MRTLLVLALILNSSLALAASSPKTLGSLVNETSIPNTDLDISVGYNKLIPCKPKVDGWFCRPKVGVVTGYVKVAVKADGTYEIPKQRLSASKNFFEVMITQKTTGRVWTAGQLRLTKETWANYAPKVALFQWREESVSFKPPGGKTFAEYVNAAIASNPHLDSAKHHTWAIQVYQNYFYYNKSLFPSGFQTPNPCFLSDTYDAVSECLVTSEEKANDLAATLHSWIGDFGVPVIDFGSLAEGVLPGVHRIVLDGRVDLHIMEPETGKSAWANITQDDDPSHALKSYYLSGTKEEIFQHRLLTLEVPEKFKWVNINPYP